MARKSTLSHVSCGCGEKEHHGWTRLVKVSYKPIKPWVLILRDHFMIISYQPQKNARTDEGGTPGTTPMQESVSNVPSTGREHWWGRTGQLVSRQPYRLLQQLLDPSGYEVVQLVGRCTAGVKVGQRKTVIPAISARRGGQGQCHR